MGILNLLRLRRAERHDPSVVHLVPVHRPTHTVCGIRLSSEPLKRTNIIRKATCSLCRAELEAMT